MVSPWTLYFDIYKYYNGSSLQAFIRCCVLAEASIGDCHLGGLQAGFFPMFNSTIEIVPCVYESFKVEKIVCYNGVKMFLEKLLKTWKDNR